jgi:uncharacterized tellurite resistance protein B-like protein
MERGADGVSQCALGGIGVDVPVRLSSARPGQDVKPGDLGRESSRLAAPSQIEETMLDQLDRKDRLRLVEFVCSFAWADFEIAPEERVFVARLIRRLDLDEEEDLKVQQWLERPPKIDDLDPTAIPEAHRRVFVDAIEGVIEADGEVSDEERDSFEIFRALLEG